MIIIIIIINHILINLMKDLFFKSLENIIYIIYFSQLKKKKNSLF